MSTNKLTTGQCEKLSYAQKVARQLYTFRCHPVKLNGHSRSFKVISSLNKVIYRVVQNK